MAQMNLIVTPQFEAALERLMRRRGFTNKSEAVRTVVEEVAEQEETPEEIRAARAAALDRMTGAWAGSNKLPRKGDGTLDWGAIKDEIREGMP